MNEQILAYWWLFAFIAFFEFILKGISLWKSARNSQKGWFITLLILNTAGILPIIYLLFASKNHTEQ